MEELRTIESILKALRGTPLVPPKKKRRKKDRRTVKKQRSDWRRKYYREHADEMREKQGQLKEQFYKLRRAINAKDKAGHAGTWKWELSLSEWILMWTSCPAVEVGLNTYKPAWLVRGKTRNDVQLNRLDKDKPYEINNLQIIYKQRQIWPIINPITIDGTNSGLGQSENTSPSIQS